MIYAGIGPRATSEDGLLEAYECGRVMREAGHTLRSGGAWGGDEAFVRGALAGSDPSVVKVDLFLPWRGAGRQFPLALVSRAALTAPSEEALKLAAKYHPAWERCSPAARELLGRNVHVLLGAQLDRPVDAIVATAKAYRGGTAHALRVAEGECPDVPVVDLLLGGDWRRLL